MKNVTLSQIQKDMTAMKREIEGIKKYMVDLDSLMTYDDFKALEDYRREKSRGALIPHEALKKELGL